MAVYGYARVSSADQNLNRQLDALRGFPVEDGSVFTDKSSGKDFERPGYRGLLRALRRGDVLVVCSIDRLGRSYEDILAQWRLIVRDRGADIVVLDMPLLDTRQASGDVTGTLISDIVLQLLSYVAQIEREKIRQRQAEGIASARARGVKFGRPPLPVPDGFRFILARWERGEMSCRAAAAELGVSRATFARWAAESLQGVDSAIPVCRG